MQADLIGDMTIGLTSGIEPAFQPSSWQNVEVMSATIRTVFVSTKSVFSVCTRFAIPTENNSSGGHHKN